MKRLLVIIVFFLLSTGLQAQEKANYRTAADAFIKHFNNKQFDSIHAMFDGPMKTALPKEKAEAFLKDIYTNLGAMKSMEFLKFQNVAHVYKTTFDQGLRDVLIYLNSDNEIGGLYVTMHRPADLPKLERNTTKMIWPFSVETFVFWGGETVAQNYHMAQEVQQYAYDILMVKDGASYKGDSKKNENYFVFGQEILAPCDAKVIKITQGVYDNIPGEMNQKQLLGNSIVLETDKKEYLLFAHLKKGSLLVEEGQQVKQGQVMAQCGNSGNSTEAHLHLQLQNVADFFQGTGAKLYFDSILVNGTLKSDYMPVKEDFVKNSDKK